MKFARVGTFTGKNCARTISSRKKLGLKPESRMTSLGAILLLGVPSIFSCSEAVSDSSVRTNDEHLYVLSTTLWDITSVPVCWVTSGNAAEKSWVQDAITKSWQSAAGIKFTGWNDCPSSLSSYKGIAITTNTGEMVVKGGLGQQSDNVSDMFLDFGSNVQNSWLRCSSNGLNREDCIRACSTHEFGHAIGFSHEFLRPDMVPYTCELSTNGTPGDSLPTNYDDSSIMNYSSGVACATATRLSPLDVLGSEIAYPSGIELSVNCKEGCFQMGDDLVVRTKSIVEDEWTNRGASAWWEVTSPSWTVDGLASGSGAALSLTKTDNSILTVAYDATTAICGDAVTGQSDLVVDNKKWTALALSML